MGPISQVCLSAFQINRAVSSLCRCRFEPATFPTETVLQNLSWHITDSIGTHKELIICSRSWSTYHRMVVVRGDCKDHLIPTPCHRGHYLIPYLKVLIGSGSRSRTSSALCRPGSSGQGEPAALPHPIAEILDVFRYKADKAPKQQSCYMELKVKKQILFFE